ncbi:MAG: hypothetical protein CM1200mP20_11990 [Pseudomonadota bacterium]|nr:MAG: hypothetical protein CM1200mP20_11990 [Pseudomonadota bacterium]
MTEAYESLPDSLKTRIEDLHAIHSYDHLNEFLRIRNPHRPALTERLRRDLPPVRRPLVAHHPRPDANHCICLCAISNESRVSQIRGTGTPRTVAKPRNRQPFYPFSGLAAWRPVLWDNRCTLHAPTPFDDEKYTRLMYRLTVTGDQIAGF